jgi:tripeptide aminopeptidase
MVGHDDVKDLFLQLVQIDSHSLEEAEMSAFCRAYLERLGFDVVEDAAAKTVGGITGNLIATLAGDAKLPTLLLAAHMDTVQPGRGVRPRVDEAGVVWSDGTTVLGADDKAGVTAILLGVKSLIESKRPHGTLQVVFTVAEEIGLQGAKALDPSLLKADCGLSLDSGGALGTMVTAGPSQVRWEAEFIGKPAHAGVAPEKGISAIRVAAKAVSNMQHGRIDEETTVNIGSFIAEGPNNVVRDKVTLIGEARSRNQEKLQHLLTEMERGFQQSAKAAGASVTFSSHLNYDGFRFDEAAPVRKRVQAALTLLGYEVRAVEGGGGSDANIYTSLGVPTLNIGIGYEDIHSTSEHVALDDIRRAAEVAEAFCTMDARFE